MIEIELTQTERKLIHHWIECMREESSHRGDGEVVFPDEQIVENKIDHAGPVRFTWTGPSPATSTSPSPLKRTC